MIKVMINHAIAAVTGPLGLWFLAMIAVAVLIKCRQRKWAWRIGVLAAFILWAFSCGWMGRIVGLGLERMYPPVPMAEVPQADVILILGGGMGANPEVSPYAEMYGAADRVWHAARLWKAGKAPLVMASGTNEVYSTKPLLLDLGVPETAIRIENEARNTEENAKFVERMMQGKTPGAKPKMLLVTSAWHMRRAKLMFERYAPGLEIIAAPCDHEAILYSDEPLSVKYFFPSADALVRNSYMVKEIIGYWGYKLLR